MDLSGTKLAGLKAVVSAMSDDQLRQLEAALIAQAQAGDGQMLAVLDSVGSELTDRATAKLALAPLAPLIEGRGPAAFHLPPKSGQAFWQDVRVFTPAIRKEAVATFLRLRNDDPIPPVFDTICLQAAERLRAGEGALAALVGEQGHSLARMLSLVSVLRSAMCHLEQWVGRNDAATIAAARLTLRDAVAIDEDAAPLLVHVLGSHLTEPIRVLRLIAAMTDQPSDRVLAGSELAPFGEALLAELDAHVAALRDGRFGAGAAAGAKAGSAARAAAEIIHEFETNLHLSLDGPWAARVSRAKRAVASAGEAKMREVEPSMAAALPLQPARVAARFLKGVPKLSHDPEPRAVQGAQGAAAFLLETRSVAAVAGFGAIRLKVVETLQDRFAHYVDDLLDVLRDDPAHERARTYLALAADMVEAVEGEAAADVVRRRLVATQQVEAQAA